MNQDQVKIEDTRKELRSLFKKFFQYECRVAKSWRGDTIYPAIFEKDFLSRYPAPKRLYALGLVRKELMNMNGTARQVVVFLEPMRQRSGFKKVLEDHPYLAALAASGIVCSIIGVGVYEAGKWMR